MPCKLNHNLICLSLGPLFKGLETNLKLLTNSNAQFHWTLLFGPLSKVAFSIVQRINMQKKITMPSKKACKKE
jgi:hypothetical protein